MTKHEIIPAILPASAREFQDTFAKLENPALYLHLDVLEKDIWVDLHTEFEAHLMVREPEQILGKWIDRGANRVIVHSLTNQILAERHLVEIGLGINLDVPFSQFVSLVPMVDFVHLMSIAEIGVQGNPFETRIFDRIKKFRAIFPEVTISVDGGINLDNADDLFLSGADRLCVGSAIVKEEHPAEALREFNKLVYS